ncbi:oxidoreductase [Brachionus plicatilis]|uniref:Oxidoreductase n=1 Tax=Brachionus plicatilis TaxID=10195 RepID=A0A3M7S4F1_BRAPC|nr:oxidoreductase [Brachionus plicatilis]
MDFCKLKSQIIDLTENLKLVNSSYKQDKNGFDFMQTEKSSILKLSEQIGTTVNILKKIKRKSCDPALSTPMKRQKLAEKDHVTKQLDQQLLDKMPSRNKMLSKLINNVAKKSDVINQCFQDNTLNDLSKRCYICKIKFKKMHHFYDQICGQCGDFNYSKRQQTCDFGGKTALVTGCRIKIGYQICLFLLRNKCSQLIGTTRFPKDAYTRFSQEPDFDSFKTRLKIYPLDLRDLNSISKLVTYLNSSLTKLDILINNAAQTIRRNVKFYEHLLEIESRDQDQFDQNIKSVLINDKYLEKNNFLKFNDVECCLNLKDNNLPLSVVQSQIALVEEDFAPVAKNFPKDVYDKDRQQVDLSSKCSWNKVIDEIDMFEFAETQVINSWAPFMICSRLKGLMSRNREEPKFIVNVSSMEGKFNRYKNVTHPHTNMSKASLNMLTRTCGPDFAQHNIFMTSVDTGWVSEMNPSHVYSYEKTVPLDEFDGAIRVLDPIIQGYNDNVFLHSVFLKDFKKTEW